MLGSLAQADEDKEAKKAYASAKRKKQMERLRDMFLELDEDGSGELTMEEIEMLDYDASGTVGTDEFCDGVIKASAGVSSDGPTMLGEARERLSEQAQYC
eukprot:Skav208240  [mRNA]  locus=scaffold2601:289455:294542:+ [translate_table: standard]